MTGRGHLVAWLGIFVLGGWQVLGQAVPIANAGLDRHASIGERVVVDGSASTSPDGGPLVHAWSFVLRPEGSGATLSDPTAVAPVFVVDVPGDYVLRLVVTRNEVTSAPDFVVISAANRPPVADAGPDLAGRVGDALVLDGSQSFDPDGDRLAYRWSFRVKPDCSRAALTDPQSVQSGFVLDCPGTYLLVLTVSDGIVSTDDGVVVLTENSAPRADAGRDQTADIGRVVRLDGSRSTDLDGNAIAYSWTIVSQPVGGNAVLDDSRSAFPTFVPNVPGGYRFRLTVTDGVLTSAPDVVVVSTTNSPPMADAGRDQRVAPGELVRLDATRSSDPDHQQLQFSWTFESRPSQSVAVLNDPTGVRPSFVPDVEGTYVLRLVVDDGLMSSAPDSVRVSTGNVPPEAHAGPDQPAAVGAFVRLSASGSTDSDGDELGFRWALIQQPASSAAILFNVAAVRPAFVPDVPGTYVLQLVATDGRGISEPDVVVVSTVNLTPTADAGSDQTVPGGGAALLDGARSTDPNGDPLTYRWSIVAKPPTSNAALAPDFATTTLTPDAPGTYVVSLQVSDGTLNSAPDTVLVDTNNSMPVADAGTDQEVKAGTVVMLDGTGSRDPDNSGLSYRWSLIVRPISSRAALSDATSPTPFFTADAAGTYVAQLVVNDGFAPSEPSTVLVVAVNRTNPGPVANAGPDQQVLPGSLVTLDGTASFDPDGDALTFSWSLTPPPGSSATLFDPTTATPTFAVDVRGAYRAQLVVGDGELTATDFVDVVANNRPVADILANPTVEIGEIVQLDGRSSFDPDGDPLTFLWTLVAPEGSQSALDNRTSATPTFVPDMTGSYVVQLVVNDGLDDSDPASFVIAAAPAPDTAIDCGETIGGTIGNPLRKDKYTFAAQAGEVVVFAVVGAGGTIRPRADLLGPDGRPVAGGLAVNNSSLPAVLSLAGTYSITVADDDLRDVGEYNLSLQFTTGRCARLIGCGDTVTGAVPGGANATARPQAQVDAYTFTGQAGEAVVFAAMRTTGLLRPRADLFGPNGRFVPGGLAIENSSLSATLPVTGQYTIVVRDDDLKDAGTYNLALQFTTGRCASEVACGETRGGVLPNGSSNQTGAPHGQLDAYFFSTARTDEAVIFTAMGSAGLLRARADLYDPSGRLVTGGLAVNGSSLSARLATPGRYTLIVRDDDLRDQGSYGMSLQFTTGRCGEAIECGQTLGGVIPHVQRNSTRLPHAQQDSYSFVGNAGEAVIFTAMGSSGTVRARGDLYDPLGRFVTGGLAVNGSSLPAILQLTGRHTLVLRDDDLRDGGTYNVSLQFTTGRCGVSLTCGVPVTATIPGADNTTGLPHAEQDAYTIAGSPGEQITYAVVRTAGTIRPRGDLFNPAGQFTPGGLVVGGTTLPITLGANGSYTIIVRDDDLRDGGSYSVRYDRAGGCPPDNRPPVADAEPEQAAVAVATPLQLDGSRSSDLDGDPLAYLWTIVEQPPGSVAVFSDATLVNPTFTADLTGSYVIQLVVSDGHATSEPDTIELNVSLFCGQTVGGTIGVAGEHDTFSFNANAGEAVVFAAVATSGPLRAVADLVAPDGRVLRTSPVNSLSVETVLADAGSYRLVVRDDTLAESGSYNMNVQFTTGRCAAPVECGATLRGSIPGGLNRTTSPAAQLDAYSFSATAGEAVAFAAVAAAGAFDAVVRLYGPDGLRVEQSPVNFASVSTRIAAPGTYTLIVSDALFRAGGDYNVNVQFTTGRCAAPITCGATLHGDIPGGANTTTHPEAQQDSYVFTGTAGDVVTFTPMATSGSVQTVARLFDPEGTLIGQSPVNFPSVSTRLLMTGAYTLIVSDANFREAGGYNINLQSTTGSCAVALACGVPVTAPIGPPGHHDSYSFQALTGDVVAFGAAAATPPGETIASLFAPDGRQIAIAPVNFSSPPVTLADNGTYTILVRAHVSMDGGTYTVRYEQVGGCSPVGGQIEVQPASLDFGDQVQGTTGPSQIVTLTNGSRRTVAIQNVRVDGEYIVVSNTCSPELPAGSPCEVSVAFSPALTYATGVRPGAVQIDTDGGSFSVPLTANAIGSPGLTIEPAELVFGDVLQGEQSGGLPVTLTNTGQVPLEIGGFTTLGDFELVTSDCPLRFVPNPEVLAPGARCTANVRFTPALSYVVGVRTGTLNVGSNAGSTEGNRFVEQTVSLTGNAIGTPELAIAPPELLFGDGLQGQQSSVLPLTLTNTGQLPLEIGGFAVVGDFELVTSNCPLRFVPNPEVLAPGASCTANVRFTPTLTYVAGLRTGTLKVGSNAGSTAGNRFVEQTVSLTGNAIGTPELAIAPSELVFGDVLQGQQSAVLPLTLTNVGQLPLEIGGFTPLGEFVLVTTDCPLRFVPNPEVLAPGASCTANVRFTPTLTFVIGARTGTLSISSNTGGTEGNRFVDRAVPLTGNATGVPLASFTSAVASCLAATVTLTSSGDLPLHVFAATTDSGLVVNAGNCPVGGDLAPSTSCTFELSFVAPLQTGVLQVLTTSGSTAGPTTKADDLTLVCGTVTEPSSLETSSAKPTRAASMTTFDSRARLARAEASKALGRVIAGSHRIVHSPTGAVRRQQDLN